MRSTQAYISIAPTLGRSLIAPFVYYMEGGICQSACASLAACIAGAFLADAIPSDRCGDQLWDEASAILFQFESDLGRSIPADTQTPSAQAASQGQVGQDLEKTNPTLHLGSLLSSRPPIAHVLLEIKADVSAAGSSGTSGTTDAAAGDQDASTAAGSSSGTTKAAEAAGDLSWLCGPRTHALMHEVVDTVWPRGSSNMV